MRLSRRSCLALAVTPVGVKRALVLTVPLHIHVARCHAEPVPVKPDDWVQLHVAAAQTVLETHGVSLLATISSFSPPKCDLLTRAHRDEVAPFAATKEAVNVLVLNRIRDLDVPDYDLMGVHWRYGGQSETLKRRRWVFLTARAQPPVLAHELCHFFGLPHDPAGGNLMTPGPSSPAWRSKSPPAPFAPILTKPQANQLRSGIESWRALGFH
jgi:hypothetical protein